MRVPYFILIVLAAGALWLLNGKYFQEELVLYGFAETKETEINLNYPVMIDQLNIISGQSVKKGDLLLVAKRLDSDIRFDDQELKINEINAKKNIWKSDQQAKLRTLDTNHTQRLGELNSEISNLNIKLKSQKELYKGLDTVLDEPKISADHPVLLKIKDLEERKRNAIEKYNLQKSQLQATLAKGTKDEDEAIKRLEAEYQHKVDNEEVPVEIIAPTDGLIGNVHCKDGEHITDYRTLISFYEPNPTIVKAYVHEDYLVSVTIGDEFKISSIKDETKSYNGKVIGLGSRIVEIPTRMRKVPEHKVYGREVMVRLPRESQFLQNEKLILNAQLSN